MTGNFTFGGISAANYGVSVDCSQSFATPQRIIEVTQVLGRNGDHILYDPGTFENVIISYPCFIPSEFTSRFSDFLAHLYAKQNYQTLTDTAHPGLQRSAYFVQAVTPQTGVYNKSGMFTLQFSCGPWYLSLGLSPIDFTENGRIVNPTPFVSKPKYYVEGVGTVTLGIASFTTTASPTNIDVDHLETDNPFTGPYVRLSPGETEIVLGEGITLLRITPRWWTI